MEHAALGLSPNWVPSSSFPFFFWFFVLPLPCLETEIFDVFGFPFPTIFLSLKLWFLWLSHGLPLPVLGGEGKLEIPSP